jgi:hypothetical protein
VKAAICKPEIPHQKPTLLEACSVTSSFWNYEKINSVVKNSVMVAHMNILTQRKYGISVTIGKI